jgi:hypothetical protein
MPGEVDIGFDAPNRNQDQLAGANLAAALLFNTGLPYLSGPM